MAPASNDPPRDAGCVIRAHDVDCGAAYEAVRAELVALVAAASAEERERAVPATPAWSVLDVVAHVVGLAVDLNAGRFPGEEGADAWTERQVTERRGRSLDQLAGEWDEAGPIFAEGLRTFGYEVGCHFLADLLAHRADVGAALGHPGLPPSPARTAGVDWYLDVAHLRLVEAGRGGVEMIVDGEAIRLGPEPVLASVALDGFEAFRALGARRSLGQLAGLPWQGDPSGVLELLAAYPAPPEPGFG